MIDPARPSEDLHFGVRSPLKSSAPGQYRSRLAERRARMLGGDLVSRRRAREVSSESYPPTMLPPYSVLALRLDNLRLVRPPSVVTETVVYVVVAEWTEEGRPDILLRVLAVLFWRERIPPFL